MVWKLCNTARQEHIDNQADGLLQMEEVVQGRREDNDKAQATAASLNTELKTALVSSPAITHCCMCQLDIN